MQVGRPELDFRHFRFPRFWIFSIYSFGSWPISIRKIFSSRVLFVIFSVQVTIFIFSSDLLEAVTVRTSVETQHKD